MHMYMHMYMCVFVYISLHACYSATDAYRIVQEVIYLVHGKKVPINARDPERDYMTALHMAAVNSKGMYVYVCMYVILTNDCTTWLL